MLYNNNGNTNKKPSEDNKGIAGRNEVNTNGRVMLRSNPYEAQSAKQNAELLVLLVVSVTVMLIVITAFFLVMSIGNSPDIPSERGNNVPVYTPITDEHGGTIVETAPPTTPTRQSYIPTTTADTKQIFQNEMNAQYAILVDVQNGNVLAQRLADDKIYPASMTKLMTLIIAVENTTNLYDTFEMTAEIIDPLWRAQASRAGFIPGDDIPIIDLLYGAILPSGADATAALAIYIAGSEENFAVMMNEKAASMGLTGTHFVNASGLYEDEHYSTVRDIAAILAYALDNSLCRKILTATFYDPIAELDGIAPSGYMQALWYSKIKGNHPEGFTLLGAKSGYETKAGNCLASFAADASGKEYILVTAKGSPIAAATAERPFTEGKYQPIYDLKHLYPTYAK